LPDDLLDLRNDRQLSARLQQLGYRSKPCYALPWPEHVFGILLHI
jgi:hypothetical protein